VACLTVLVSDAVEKPATDSNAKHRIITQLRTKTPPPDNMNVTRQLYTHFHAINYHVYPMCLALPET